MTAQTTDFETAINEPRQFAAWLRGLDATHRFWGGTGMESIIMWIKHIAPDATAVGPRGIALLVAGRFIAMPAWAIAVRNRLAPLLLKRGSIATAAATAGDIRSWLDALADADPATFGWWLDTSHD